MEMWSRQNPEADSIYYNEVTGKVITYYECPEEYREFCNRTGYKWSKRMQSAYTKGHIKELWLTDSVKGRYMKTIYKPSPVGFSDHKKKQAEEQWNRIRENHGVKAKEIEESTGINQHVGE